MVTVTSRTSTLMRLWECWGVSRLLEEVGESPKEGRLFGLCEV